MGRLFCLMGKSGTGKDTVFKRLICDSSLALSPVVPYTTRPRRKNEQDGSEYHFITEEQLKAYKEADKIIEMRRYDTVKGAWFYATIDDGKIDLSVKNYLTITTLEAFSALQKRFGKVVIPLYITVDDGERLTRALNREKKQQNPDYSELCRRYLADADDFSETRLQKAGVEQYYKNENLNACVKEIKKTILLSVADGVGRGK